MTTSQIIACAISWTAAIVAITALVSVRRARREPVRWETDGCVVTFDRKITEEEMAQFRTKWERTHSRLARTEGEIAGWLEIIDAATDEEESGA